MDLDQKTVNFILDLICDKCGLSDFKESEDEHAAVKRVKQAKDVMKKDIVVI